MKTPLEHYLFQDDLFSDAISLSMFWKEITKDRLGIEINASSDVLSLMNRHVQSFRSHLTEVAKERITAIYSLPDDVTERRDKIVFLLSKERFNCPEEHYQVTNIQP